MKNKKQRKINLCSWTFLVEALDLGWRNPKERKTKLPTIFFNLQRKNPKLSVWWLKGENKNTFYKKRPKITSVGTTKLVTFLRIIRTYFLIQELLFGKSFCFSLYLISCNWISTATRKAKKLKVKKLNKE